MNCFTLNFWSLENEDFNFLVQTKHYAQKDSLVVRLRVIYKSILLNCPFACDLQVNFIELAQNLFYLFLDLVYESSSSLKDEVHRNRFFCQGHFSLENCEKILAANFRLSCWFDFSRKLIYTFRLLMVIPRRPNLKQKKCLSPKPFWLATFLRWKIPFNKTFRGPNINKPEGHS
jgi:hypothetical protein